MWSKSLTCLHKQIHTFAINWSTTFTVEVLKERYIFCMTDWLGELIRSAAFQLGLFHGNDEFIAYFTVCYLYVCMYSYVVTLIWRKPSWWGGSVLHILYLYCIYVWVYWGDGNKFMYVHYYYCNHAIYEVYGINQARAQRGPGTGEGGILYISHIYGISPFPDVSSCPRRRRQRFCCRNCLVLWNQKLRSQDLPIAFKYYKYANYLIMTWIMYFFRQLLRSSSAGWHPYF